MIIQMEQELICDVCNGTGYTVDGSARKEVCDACYGLGSVKGVRENVPLSPSKRRIRRALIYTFTFLFIYYGIFFYSYVRFHPGPAATIIILLIGHFAAVTYLVAFVLFSSVYTQ